MCFQDIHIIKQIIRGGDEKHVKEILNTSALMIMHSKCHFPYRIQIVCYVHASKMCLHPTSKTTLNEPINVGAKLVSE